MSETVLIKKKEYEVLSSLGEHSYKLNKDGVTYFGKVFGKNTRAFDNFLYAHKRLKSSGVSIPKVYKVDKKQGFVLMEYIDAPTIFDLLREKDLDEIIYQRAFENNFLAKVSGILLDFDPRNFRYFNDKLIYTPYLFDVYKKDKDFTEDKMYIWYYTKRFTDLLISEGLPIDKSRIKNEYERNKEIVLKVVKYYK